MTTLEKEVEKKLRLMVTKHKGMCLKWVCPGWSGVPDRIILLPGGRIIFCEAKRPKGGKFAVLQNKWREWLTGLGFTVVSAKNNDEIAKLESLITGEVQP